MSKRRKRMSKNDVAEQSTQPSITSSLFGPDLEVTECKTKRTMLLDLLQNGDIEMFKTLAPRFLLTHDRDISGKSILHRVVRRCTPNGYNTITDVLELILREDPKMTNLRDNNGDTPLLLACDTSVCPELIFRLIEANPDTLHEKNNLGNVPLLKFLDTVQVGSGENETSLASCCQVLVQLCSLGKNVNFENKCRRNSMSMLLSRADMSSDHRDTLVEILLKHGALLTNTRGKHVFQNFNKITFKLIESIVKYLPEEITEDKDICILSSIFKQYSPNEDEEELLKLLEIAIMKPFSEDNYIIGVNVVNKAVERNFNFEVIKFLLNQTSGYNCSYNNSRGAFNKYLTSAENVSELILRGFDPNKYGEHCPLHAAAVAKSPGAIIKLLENGADPLLLFFERETGVPDILLFVNYIMHEECSSDVLKCVLDSLKRTTTNKREISKYYWTLILKIYRNMNVMSETNIKKKLQILADKINSNSIDLNTQTDITNYVTISGFKHLSQTYVSILDPVAYMIYTYREHKINGEHDILKFIKMMLESGFQIRNTPEGELTSLTVFLLSLRKSDCKEELLNLLILPMVDLLIQYGVDVHSSSVESYSKFLENTWITESCERKCRELDIPDALFLSLWCYESVDLIQRFLVHWWGPPLVLTAILPVYQKSSWAKMYKYFNEELVPFLVKYSHLPYGLSLITENTWSRMDMWREGRNFDFETTKTLEISTPLSLQDLCKYQVRNMLSMSQQTSQLHISMPDLINQVLPYELPPSIHNILA